MGGGIPHILDMHFQVALPALVDLCSVSSEIRGETKKEEESR